MDTTLRAHTSITRLQLEKRKTIDKVETRNLKARSCEEELCERMVKSSNRRSRTSRAREKVDTKEEVT